MNFKNIHNVGINKDGVSYNSYLITAKKNVLIDTVPLQFCDEFFKNIEKLIDIQKIDYVILNHTEQDRSGLISEITKRNKNAKIVATVAGLKNIKEQINQEINELAIKSNMVLELDSDNSLKFIIAHNINWPDSMMTYHIENCILFSCDAFSKEDSNDTGKIYFEKNLSQLSDYVYNAIQKLKELEIDVIMPGNGDIIKDVDRVICDYLNWSKPKEKKNKKICVIYESFSGNTKFTANRVKSILKDIDVILCDVNECSADDILDTIYDCDGVLFGTPTINRNIPQKTAKILMSLNHFKIGEKIFASFGSYGWSGEGPNLVYSVLRARHFKTFKTPFRYLFSADNEILSEFDKYILSFYENVINI